MNLTDVSERFKWEKNLLLNQQTTHSLPHMLCQ
jgi:hypothetical protein